MTKVKLYNFALSPFGRRVYFCLLYKGIQFENVFVTIGTWEELEFAQEKRVPTLTIGDETRQESVALCLWLDEVFPDTPKVGGQNESQREEIIALNRWIDDTIFSNGFRMMVDPYVRDYAWYRSGLSSWAVAKATSKAPEEAREQWPFGALSTPFVYEHAAASFAAGPAHLVLQRTVEELERHIDRGPFMGGLELPTIADFSVYGQIAMYALVGFESREQFLQRNAIRDWVDRVESHLPIGVDMIPNELRRVSLPLVHSAG